MKRWKEKYKFSIRIRRKGRDMRDVKRDKLNKSEAS
jgi:hypothetical protein